MRTILTTLMALMLAACSRPIPPDIQNALDRHLASRPMENGWKFVKVTHGFGGRELVVDILVPEPLGADAAAQQEMLRSKFCPAAVNNGEFWQKLKGYKLSVVAYTRDRKFTVLADCENPYEREDSHS
jgi:hypothetical protein